MGGRKNEDENPHPMERDPHSIIIRERISNVNLIGWIGPSENPHPVITRPHPIIIKERISYVNLIGSSNHNHENF